MVNVKIGPITYEVVEEKGLTCREGHQKLMGQISYDECRIQIEAGITAQPKRQVLWHEILHGIATHAGLSTEDDKLIDVLAYGIMGVLQDNPWLKD